MAGLPVLGPATLPEGTALCSRRGWIPEGRVFPMNHNHSWSWPSPLPSPHSHFLICKIRSHSPENVVVPMDSDEGGGGAGSDLWWAERGLLEGPRVSQGHGSLPWAEHSLRPEIPPSVLVAPCALRALWWKAEPSARTRRPQRGLWPWVTSWSFFLSEWNKQRIKLGC